MLAYRAKTDEHKRYYCSAGSRYENTYQEQINKKSGKKELVKIGETNVYERIQADLEQSKIENIINRIAKGDMEVFKEARLTYVDADDFPQTLMEAQNIVVKAKAEFDKMPAEVRDLFHNSPEEYVSQIGTDEFVKKLAPYNDEIAKKQKEDKDAAFNAQVKEAVAFNKAVEAEMGVKTE